MSTTQFTARLEEQDIELFKQFCSSNNLTTAQAFNSMINLLELDKAKSTIAARSKEIEQFQSYANSMVKAFITSLEINENAETRIREEFAKQLDSQLDTIADLRSKIKGYEDKAEEAIKKLEEGNKIAEIAINEANLERDNTAKQVVDLTDKLEKLESQVENDKEVIALLKDKSNKYEADSIAYQEAKVNIEELKNTISELKDNIKDINSEHTIKLKEIELQHEKELSNNKTELQAIIAAKELEIANVKADTDRKYFEAQNKYNDELHELKSQIKDLINDNEKLKDKLSKFEAEQEVEKK